MKTRFANLSAVAREQGCVLERESRGYSLYSNVTFTQADCADLNEVAECLAFDPSFGALPMPVVTIHDPRYPAMPHFANLP